MLRATTETEFDFSKMVRRVIYAAIAPHQPIERPMSIEITTYMAA